MHSELHIWFVLCFLVDYEHLVLTIISDPILLYDISQSYNIGYGSLAEPNVFVITRHLCLVGHYYGSTTALESHTATGFERLCDQCYIAEQINCGLTVQSYYLPEVKLIVEIWRLIEELCDVWLEFSVQLCKLEYPA